jgi:hypothetical protein
LLSTLTPITTVSFSNDDQYYQSPYEQIPLGAYLAVGLVGMVIMILIKTNCHDPPLPPGEKRSCGVMSVMICCFCPCGWTVGCCPVDTTYDPLTDPARMPAGVPYAVLTEEKFLRIV